MAVFVLAFLVHIAETVGYTRTKNHFIVQQCRYFEIPDTLNGQILSVEHKKVKLGGEFPHATIASPARVTIVLH